MLWLAKELIDFCRIIVANRRVGVGGTGASVRHANRAMSPLFCAALRRSCGSAAGQLARMTRTWPAAEAAAGQVSSSTLCNIMLQ